MPKVSKTLHGDAELIAKKIAHGIASFGTLIGKMDEWTTEADGHRVIVQIYEKLSATSGAPHYSMTVVLFDTGEEVRLYATSSGGNRKFENNPYLMGEGEPIGVLTIVLGALDSIIL